MPSPLLTVWFLFVCIQYAVGMYYHVEYTIQETTCTKSADAAKPDNCPPMDCEFAVSPNKLKNVSIHHFILIQCPVQCLFFKC